MVHERLVLLHQGALADEGADGSRTVGRHAEYADGHRCG